MSKYYNIIFLAKKKTKLGSGKQKVVKFLDDKMRSGKIYNYQFGGIRFKNYDTEVSLNDEGVLNFILDKKADFLRKYDLNIPKSSNGWRIARDLDLSKESLIFNLESISKPSITPISLPEAKDIKYYCAISALIQF